MKAKFFCCCFIPTDTPIRLYICISAVPFLNEPSIIIFNNSMNQIKAKAEDVDTNKIRYIYIARYFCFMVHSTRSLHI